MLVDPVIVKQIIEDHGIQITGAFHIGAHLCEELWFYSGFLGLSNDQIVWIDANESKVNECIQKGIPNVYHAVVTDKDGDTVNFHIANNGESSSILEMNTHSQQYPHIFYVDQIEKTTTTIDTFFKTINKSPENLVFWNLDIQGAELLALSGGVESMKYAKVIYLEVNVDELYKDCARINQIDDFLGSNGFKRVHLTMSPYGWGDAIYLRENA